MCAEIGSESHHSGYQFEDSGLTGFHGEKMMKRCVKRFWVEITVVLLSVLLLPSSVFSDEGTCYLKAVTEVYVEVYDLDRQGNDGEMIWSGRLKDGEKVLIKAPHARFRYKYNSEPDEKQALSVGPDKWCDGKNNVAVP